MDEKWARRLCDAIQHKRNPNQRRNRRALYVLYLFTIGVVVWTLWRWALTTPGGQG